MIVSLLRPLWPQQGYLEYVCLVTMEAQSYPDLYRDYVSSDLAAFSSTRR